MIEQWQELKDTIIELRDGDGTGTQQEVCKFLANYMDILEKQMQTPCEDEDMQTPCEDEDIAIKSIATAFQFGMALGFAKKYDEIDKVMEEIKKVCISQPKMGCEGCTYEKTGNNSTYPCSHCSRCYTDKYKAESKEV